MSEAAQQSVTQEQTSSAPVSDAPANETGLSIPDQYSDRGWVSKLETYDDVWKLIDNQSSLIGKRPEGIPSKDAPQEEWDKFYKALGRPDEASSYEFSVDIEDSLPDGVDKEKVTSLLSGYKEKVQKYTHMIGASPEKAQEVWDEIMKDEIASIGEYAETEKARQSELDKEFDSLANTLFGDSFNDVAEQAKQYLANILPEELSDTVAGLEDNPKALLAMIKIAHESQQQIVKVKKEYGAEDSLSSGEQSTGLSANELNKKLADAKKRYQEAPVFSPDRRDIQAEIDGYRTQLQKMVNK